MRKGGLTFMAAGRLGIQATNQFRFGFGGGQGRKFGYGSIVIGLDAIGVFDAQESVFGVSRVGQEVNSDLNTGQIGDSVLIRKEAIEGEKVQVAVWNEN